LEQCAKLSTGQPLFELCSLHKKWLRIYAENVLIVSLKGSAHPSLRNFRHRSDTSTTGPHRNHNLVVLEILDYCLSTVSELEDKMQEKINNEFKEHISFQAERDMFVSHRSETARDAAPSTTARTTWASTGQ
ncbi:hypothetical protein DXG01_012002, partial [Tephrocybe rancida]